MSLPQATGGYGSGPGEGEALWFNGGPGVLKANGRPNGGTPRRDGAAGAQGIRVTTSHPQKGG